MLYCMLNKEKKRDCKSILQQLCYNFYIIVWKIKISIKTYIHLQQLVYFSNPNIKYINKIFNISIKILFLFPPYPFSMSFIGGKEI